MGCSKLEPASAPEIFEKRLRDHGVDFEIDGVGLYVIRLGDNTLTVSLENIAREFTRSGDRQAVRNFADQVATDFAEPIPSWNEIRAYLRFQLEPDDYVQGFEKVVHNRVAEGLMKVFVFLSQDGTQITWVSRQFLEDWQVAADDVVAVAESNMSTLANEASIELKEVDGVSLGMVATSEEPFKASLLLANGFQDLVEPALGFPVYAVAPSRDFVFLIAVKDQAFLGRLGRVVLDEFEKSGHSVTPDILEVGEKGLSVFGGFKPLVSEGKVDS